MGEDQPLQVARCTKIIQDEKDPEKSKYVINVKQLAKFVVKLGERVSPTDIEEGMRVGQVLQPPSNTVASAKNMVTVSSETNTRSYFHFLQRLTLRSP